MLQIQNISVNIHSKSILTDVSFDVDEGEMVALCGPNGAGKSTLLRVISGELKQTTGSVALKDTAIEQWKPLKLAQMRAKLSQESVLTFAFLAQEVVEMGRFPYHDAVNSTEVVESCMRQVGIEHLAHRQYTSLSGGEKQRVHLARVLAQLHSDKSETKLMLLDEPTSALDVLHQEVVLELAHKLAKERNYTVIVVLHDLNLAAAWADRIVLLKDGMYRYDDVPHRVLTPQIIKEVYGIDSLVLTHPQTGRPIITVDREQRINPQ